jgi:hypothetical protein
MREHFLIANMAVKNSGNGMNRKWWSDATLQTKLPFTHSLTHSLTHSHTLSLEEQFLAENARKKINFSTFC